MFNRIIIILAVITAILGAEIAMAAGNAAALPAGLQKTNYNDWPDCLFLSAPRRPVTAMVAPAIGGRIIQFNSKGENILYEPGSESKALYNMDPGFRAGGSHCDVGPEIRGIPAHPRIWLGQYEWDALDDYFLTLTSPPDFTLGVQLERELVLDPIKQELGLAQRLFNITDHEISYCLWDRTLCQGGGYAFFPLNKKSRFKAGWAIRRTVAGKPLYDGEDPDCPQVRVIKGVLIAETKGEPTKLGADSSAGWIAYVRGKLLFIKYFPVFPGENYSDGGNTVELYFDDQVASLEPLSPEVRLQPGESFEFPEKWLLIRLSREIKSMDAARALVKRVPKYNFRKSALQTR